MARARWLLLGGSGHVAHPHGCCGGHGRDAGTNPDTPESQSHPRETNAIRTPRPASCTHRDWPGGGNPGPSIPRRVRVSRPTAAPGPHPPRRWDFGTAQPGWEQPRQHPPHHRRPLQPPPEPVHAHASGAGGRVAPAPHPPIERCVCFCCHSCASLRLSMLSYCSANDLLKVLCEKPHS